MSRRQLLRAMDAQELLEWRVLEQVDPWGQRRDDLRIALLSAQIANYLGATRQDGQPVQVEALAVDFPDAPDADVVTGLTDAAVIEQSLVAGARAAGAKVYTRAEWEARQQERATVTPTTPATDAAAQSHGA